MKNRVKGFTLVELMVTLVVAILLMLIGVPQFQSMTASNRAAADANKMVAGLRLARSEAVTRGVEVSLCAANADADACSNDWAEGLLVFLDPGGAGRTVGDVDAAADILRVMEAPKGNPIITGSANYLRFDPNGALQGPNSTFQFDVRQEKCSGRNRRTIAVSATGNLNVVAGDCP